MNILILRRVFLTNMAGMNTTAGSFALLGSIVPGDSGVVKRLRKAGAILLGKLCNHYPIDVTFSRMIQERPISQSSPSSEEIRHRDGVGEEDSVPIRTSRRAIHAGVPQGVESLLPLGLLLLHSEVKQMEVLHALRVITTWLGSKSLLDVSVLSFWSNCV